MNEQQVDNLEQMDKEIIVDDADTKEADIYENGSIYPYDMPDEVDIREDYLTVFEWLRKLKKGQLIVNPEFQRNLVWKDEQKNGFIESVLLNIPLPPFYVNQTKNGKYIIVDGLQRTSTLQSFVREDGFNLEDLKVLSKLNGFAYKDLDSLLQTRIEDKKLLLYVIKPSVPISMVFDIFNRVNTGGTQLTRQEIRNCLFIGKATRLLKELSEEDYFRRAIDGGISPKRMKDREAVLRFLAFRLLDYKTEYKNDMDEFLSNALRVVNKMDDKEIKKLKMDFERVMKLTYEFFGLSNFRMPTDYTRGRINIALLESSSYFFLKNSEKFLKTNKKKILSNYKKLLDDWSFKDAIRSSTSDKKRVLKRFDLAQEILGDV